MYQFGEDDKKLFRVRRNVVAGELVSIELDLLRKGDMVNLVEGDEFITGFLNHDPWESR